MADIEKIFHQLFLIPNDTNALRFLWRESPHEVVSDYKMLVHIFGEVDSSCCANWTLRKVPEMVDKSLKGVVANNFHMDDFLISLSDKESLIRLSLSVISCLKTCGFRLTKWESNSKVNLENIPYSELSPKFLNLDPNSQTIERVLGMLWNVSEDCLEKSWNNWYQKLNEITNIALPCWIGYDNKNKYYIKRDASGVAYRIVAYIKLTNLENKEIKCSFILAKSWWSPMK